MPVWSQVEEAWRDTLVHKAEGEALTRLSTMYGFRWPTSETSERAWRGAFHHVALGPRGTFMTSFQTVEAALSDMNEAVQVDVDEADPGVMVSASPLTDAYINRYVRTTSGLFWTTGFDGGDPTRVMLAPIRTAYWDPPAWDFSNASTITVTVEFLPFRWFERSPGETPPVEGDRTTGEPCLVEISLLELPYEATPPTYLLDPGGVATPVGMDYNGHVLDDADEAGNQSGVGPYPVYLFDGAELPGTARQIDLTLAAGVSAVIGLNPFV